MKLSDYSHIYFCCRICGDRVKLGKNRGGFWDTGYPQSYLEDFLNKHSDCGFDGLYISGNDD